MLFTNKFRFLSWLFCCLTCSGYAQVDTAFVGYLSRNQLRTEHFAYLGKQAGGPGTAYQLAKYYLQYPNDTLFLENFRRESALFCADSNAVNRASTHFLQPSPQAAYWFDSCSWKAPANYRINLEIARIYQAANTPFATDVNTLPRQLQSDFLLYQHAYAKKPWIAATCSAIVPGLGKLYIGNKRSFAVTLFSLSLIGLQGYESYRVHGLDHPLTVINLGLFATYYAVNIFGSYRETHRKTREIKNQYLLNASTYYHYRYTYDPR